MTSIVCGPHLQIMGQDVMLVINHLAVVVCLSGATGLCQPLTALRIAQCQQLSVTTSRISNHISTLHCVQI